MLLELKNISAGYGKKSVLSDVSFDIEDGSLLAIVGPNGAGKTTTLRVICGQLPVSRGTIFFDQKDITQKPAHEKVKRGISMVPQGGKVFKTLTTLENLEMGGYLVKNPEKFQRSLRRVYSLFPVLEERKFQLARTL
ncbi:MAG: ATP-binding cassette domain-containing protein, partial [Desulfobacterales bacterium]|nr:ATP-binding cassette domain-containing protein [Desulfobacterales bacterium]